MFASAIDGWAFTIDVFADILVEKMGFKKETLLKILWGEYYFNKKTKKIVKTPPTENSQPLFVDLIMRNIVKLYDLVLNNFDKEKVADAASKINIDLTDKQLSALPIEVLRFIMRNWLPIPKAIFETLIEHVPNPLAAAHEKAGVFFPSHQLSDKNRSEIGELLSSMEKSNLGELNLLDDDAPVFAYIAKMIPVSKKNFIGRSWEGLFEENDRDSLRYVGFAKIFSGCLRPGKAIFLMGPKHDPKNNTYDIKKVAVDNLFFWMGINLTKVSLVTAGNIFGISGLEESVFKSATISSFFNCIPLVDHELKKATIINVSISTKEVKHMPLLVAELKKLHKSDPALNYYVQSNGEHIVQINGDVHLQKCIKDLEQILVGVNIVCSAPIVNFREGLSKTNYNYRRQKVSVKCIQIWRKMQLVL